jgi:hypothetical protein
MAQQAAIYLGDQGVRVLRSDQGVRVDQDQGVRVLRSRSIKIKGSEYLILENFLIVSTAVVTQ